MNSKKLIESNSLKEALCAQQRLLQKLYNELDVEREAAATAASEAMSMIHRLQGEKAAVKMEAEQFKRLAEEKMNHAEESMEIFEEIMCQKEMEVAALDYQVQAYRYKLLSLGYDDLDPEKMLQRTDSLGETSGKSIQKRLKLPNLKKGPLERDRSITEDPDMIASLVEESLRDYENNQNLDMGLKVEHGSSSVDISSYLEQIRELDKVVEDMVGEQYSSTSSLPSKINDVDIIKTSQKSIDDKVPSTSLSPSENDVYEVPLVDETLYEDEGKSIFKDDEKVKKLTSLPQSPEKLYEIDSLNNKPVFSNEKYKKVFMPKDGSNVDCHLALVQPTTSASETEGETGVVVQNVRQEPVATREEQELRLLHEINEKLNSIQNEIKGRNTRNDESPVNLDLPVIQLREAMMDFWF
ncbi:uncharacterized protein [Rutidosis leptorrhynchoides]|uniref:uncharacterized protein n=1 Tax=Rutidosis leptorrhynchoides TaxID=125765 RepID=UPI003A995877